ncbi:MAG: O-antigen ligase family protein [Sphingomonadales bacterium]|nr:O-antigen ligase family protein [Sphingomonadales bacterium]
MAIAAVAAIWFVSLDRPIGKSAPRSALIIATCILVVPIAQLVPLPPGLWHALPGRALAREALGLVDHGDDWRSVSLAPDRTLASLLAMIPAAVILIMAASLGRRGRVLVVAVAASGALLTMVVGAAQLSQGPGSSLRFYGGGSSFLEGFQANHNSTADMLLVGLIAGLTLIRELALDGILRLPRGGIIAFGSVVAALFGLGVVLTGSRAGIALLPFALVGGAVLLRPWFSITRRGLGISLATLVAIATLGLFGSAHNAALANVLSRFTFGDELRPDLWADSLYTARAYFPVGVGMGDFVPALLQGERLEIVKAAVPNRAHNEYLELMVEAGIFGLAALGAISGILLAALVRAHRSPPAGSIGLAIFGGTALVILALHSLVDYPFRSMSLALLAAVCAGIVLPHENGMTRRGRSGMLDESQ